MQAADVPVMDANLAALHVDRYTAMAREMRAPLDPAHKAGVSTDSSDGHGRLHPPAPTSRSFMAAEIQRYVDMHADIYSSA